ncbi:glutathione S-transferase [Gongronella butleri]|nr:glutathione S-transferase [Gongronella butleri]
MSTPTLKLYNAVICPYAHRAVIALKEAGAKYEQIEIDLLNKPEWYTRVYDLGKVPLLDVDGVKIPESLVIVDLVNDLFNAKLYPEDPVKRAQIKVAIELVNIGALPFSILRDKAPVEEFTAATEKAFARLNELLLEQAPTGPYFLGETYSVADIAFAPHIGRFLAFTKHFVNGYRPAAFESYPRVNEFVQGILSRPSFKESYLGDEEYAAFIKKRFPDA